MTAEGAGALAEDLARPKAFQSWVLDIASPGASDVRSILKTAARLKRVGLGMRLAAPLPENPERSGSRPWPGICLLKKAN